MPTPPRTLGSGAANAHGTDYNRSQDHHLVAELDEDSFDRDLHEDDRAGQHAGVGDASRAYWAYDIKELHAQMPDFTDEELKQIPILAHGERLEQGALYLDLSRRENGPFTAQGSVESQDPHLYVPKARTDYVLWNKLTGVAHGGTPSVPGREA